MTGNKKVFIIAEAGVNHNGSLKMAMELIDVAAEAGADAVKFQTFKTENVISRKTPKAEYQKRTTNENESQFEMVKKLELDEEAHFVLIDHCKRRGIQFLSTPFDLESAEFLIQSCQLSIMKIASGEITNAPLLLKIARSGIPVILSTGMSTLGEVEMALAVLAHGYTRPHESPTINRFINALETHEGQEALRKNVTLLHCTTEYPTPYSEVNLRVMDTLSHAFQLPVGLSDHTPGIVIPIAAVARGAVVIEKHFTLDKNLEGPDHRASLEPQELKEMIFAIRHVEEAMGSSIKVPTLAEKRNLPIARKSIVAAVNIKKGDMFTEENLTTKRPGTGISPLYFWNLLGKRADRDYQEEEVIQDGRWMERSDM
jgi:N-acetylneuraminate synthase